MQNEVAVEAVMSGEEESPRLTLQDKAVRPADAVKLEKVKEFKSDKVDDCQKSPSRFGRCAQLLHYDLHLSVCEFCDADYFR